MLLSNLSSLSVFFLVLIPWMSLWFFCLPFPLLWPGEIMHMWEHVKGGTYPTLEQQLELPWCWWSCGSACHRFLPDFQCLFFFFFSGIISALSLSHQVLYKERDTRQVCYQNNISHTVYRPFNFTDFHGCHLSSREPQVQMGTARRNSWLVGLFWQIPTPLARSNSKWSYPQKPLLNSKIFQNLLQKQ